MIRHGLAFDVTGSGEPLLMINGIGLAREKEVLAAWHAQKVGKF